MADIKWAADERKLASAYDDLFLGRHKAVQNAMDKILKKNPKSQPALTLRLRLQLAIHSPTEKVVEGFERVKATGDFSSQTAWHVTYVLKRVHRLDLLVDMYRKLWEDHPERLEYGTELLSSAMSVWDIGTVVTATRKLFNATRNTVWAQRAAWAEWVANAPTPTTETPFHPPLSDAKPLMTAKILLATSKSTSTSSDVMWLRLQILIGTGSLKQALEVAQEEIKGASLARHWYRMEAVPVILDHSKEMSESAWETESSWALRMIQEDVEASRNYAFYRYLLKCTQKCANPKEKSQQTISALRDLHEKTGDKERAALLAILEMDNASPAETKVDQDTWLKDMEAYWARWGCKGPVVSELEGVTAGDKQKTELLTKMMEEKSKNDHSDLQAYREVVNALMFLLRQKPKGWTAEEVEVQRLWDLYKSGLAYGRNLPRTDVQYADDVGLAAVQLMLVQWSTERKDETLLLRAFACLRYILSKSPPSNHAKCLLVRLARFAGASQMMPETFFEETGPSEVQLDTVAHLGIERAAGEMQLGTIHPGWRNLVDNAQSMYQKTSVDVPDWTKQAFFKGAYAKIPGMRLLAHQVSHSLSSAVIQIESIRQSLMSGQVVSRDAVARLKAHLAQIEDAKLVDNRDWDILPDIGGNIVPIKTLIGLGREIEADSVQKLGKLVLAVDGFGDGLNMNVEEVENEVLTTEEACLINGFARLGVWMDKVKTGGNAELGDVFDFDLEGHSADISCRWEIVYNHILMDEATKYLSIILTHVEEAAKPQGTGKNRKKADPALVEIFNQIKALRSKLMERNAEAAKKLEAFEQMDQKIDWDSVAGDLIDDKDFVKQFGDEVMAARAGSIKALKHLLTGKK